LPELWNWFWKVEKRIADGWDNYAMSFTGFSEQNLGNCR
jgi:hypothetical protein